MTDYRRFLAGAPTEEVLAYFGGPYVESASRRYTLGTREVPPAPGFWRFALAGRTADVLGPAEPPDLSDRPAVRGYVTVRPGDTAYLATGSGAARRLAIGPPDEPLPFAPVLARRFPRGDLAFDAFEFESGVEDDVRAAFTQRGTLATVRGAPAALRAAFGYAVLLRAGWESSVPVRPAEARPYLAALADQGDAMARDLLALLRRERSQAETPQWTPVEDATVRPRRSDHGPAGERAADALYAAGAALRALRRLGGDQFEVRYDLDGEQFVSVVDAGTLNVIDAGICLSEHDRELTLESLPAVIREAMRTGRLYVTAY